METWSYGDTTCRIVSRRPTSPLATIGIQSRHHLRTVDDNDKPVSSTDIRLMCPCPLSFCYPQGERFFSCLLVFPFSILSLSLPLFYATLVEAWTTCAHFHSYESFFCVCVALHFAVVICPCVCSWLRYFSSVKRDEVFNSENWQ